MKKGYKKTKWGIIPNNWEDLYFGDIVTFSGGAQPPRSTFIFEEKKGYIRLIQTRDYKTDKYKTYIPEKLARKKCSKKDIMIGRYGPPIFQILRGLEGAYNVALLKAIPEEGKLFGEYLYYYITQYNVWAFVENLSQRSGGQTGVDLVQLRKYPFPLPPLPEQQKIAQILTTVDEKITLIEQQITEAQELKKGLMQQLLTKGIGHTEFKESKLGVIPKSWEVIRISNLIESNYIIGHLDGNHGALYPKANEFTTEGIPYIGANNFKDGKVNFKSCKKISLERARKFKKGIAKNGDILFAHNATVGPAAFLETNLSFVILSTTATYYRLNPLLINPKYWLFFLSSIHFKNQYTKVMGQSTRNQVPITTQRSFNAVIPPLPEQKKIAQILTTVDEKIDVLKEKKTAYQQLKKGLMQQLLTGKVRVER